MKLVWIELVVEQARFIWLKCMKLVDIYWIYWW